MVVVVVTTLYSHLDQTRPDHEGDIFTANAAWRKKERAIEGPLDPISLTQVVSTKSASTPVFFLSFEYPHRPLSGH
ncbi:hypothetical protein AMATHDRAFT_63211 [Amanita thiersii Skay4041]|uniref:Uncharacterized protein n=1 Tax=Amanita thiersii Skay4041 TaxID=703135 RepID=A0A2A9NMA7_9AGAR|nr:hypothetical protein AMATHDRAFT_63211 [Amanita thiersii Skay4041]